MLSSTDDTYLKNPVSMFCWPWRTFSKILRSSVGSEHHLGAVGAVIGIAEFVRWIFGAVGTFVVVVDITVRLVIGAGKRTETRSLPPPTAPWTLYWS